MEIILYLYELCYCCFLKRLVFFYECKSCYGIIMFVFMYLGNNELFGLYNYVCWMGLGFKFVIGLLFNMLK